MKKISRKIFFFDFFLNFFFTFSSIPRKKRKTGRKIIKIHRLEQILSYYHIIAHCATPPTHTLTLENVPPPKYVALSQARLEAPKKGGAKIARPNIEEDQTY